MKLFIWQHLGDYTGFAHARNVEEARQLLLEQLGQSDGSSPIRDRARKAIAETTPAIYIGRTAEFVLTDSAELEEADNENKRLRDQLKDLVMAAKDG